MESSSHPGPACPGGISRIPPVNGVGKPCAGEPHARIDGRELETERCTGHGRGEEQPRRETAGHPRLHDLPPIYATAPAPDPPPVTGGRRQPGGHDVLAERERRPGPWGRR